jgi:hypothetical protein
LRARKRRAHLAGATSAIILSVAGAFQFILGILGLAAWRLG